MTLYELLKKHSNEQILKTLNDNFEDVSNESYLVALDELRLLKPSDEKQEIEIYVEFSKDDFDESDNNLYLECSGIGPDKSGKTTKWGIEFDTWECWLAKTINEETLKNLDELTILAGVMWELTFSGYTQEDVLAEKMELEKIAAQAREHLKTLT